MRAVLISNKFWHCVIESFEESSLAVSYVPWDVSKNMLEEAERLCEKAGTFDFLHAKNHHPEFLKHSKEDLKKTIKEA